MNKLKWFQVYTFLLIFFAGSVSGQELMTLEKTLDVAYQNSPTIQESKLNLVYSRETLNARKASLKSKFFMNVNPFTYNHSRNFDDLQSTWYTSENMGSSGTFGVVQPITATDGTLSLINTLSFQNTYNDYSKLSTSTFSNNVQVKLDQPLFTYNQTKMDLRELELSLENTLLGYSLQKLNIEKMVSQYFYQVYQAQQSLSISNEELANQEKSYEIIKNKVDAGLSAREEFWQADLNLANARSSVYNAEVSLENAKDLLKNTIGMELNKDFNVLTNVDVKTIDVSLQDAIDYAMKQRLELRKRKIDIENSQFDLIRAKATNEFKGKVSLAVGLFGDNKQVTQIYNSPTDNEQVSLSFEIPLYDWGQRKSTIKAAEASLQVQELNYDQEKISIEMNIRQVYRNLKNLVNQINIAKKSVENAQLTYELNLEKYENGDLTSMDLSLYQNQLSSKKNELTNALISYKLELLNLKIQTLWDFETNKSIVPPAYSSEFENK